MRLSDFDYRLPKELIAQYPLPERDASRLLVLHKDKGSIEDRRFKDLILFLRKGDILVLNDTKVFKARLIGKRDGFSGKIEILLADKLEDGLYAALSSPSRKLKEGTKVIFGEGRLKAEVIGKEGDFKIIRFNTDGNLYNMLQEIGRVPLPPYIKRYAETKDEQRYQTVYAKNIGAIAAPTAGLHFTNEFIKEIKDKGVEVAYITLHVGYATFKPVKEEDIVRHKMHKEYYEISKDAAKAINEAKETGARVVSVGTTVCRALESAAVLRDTCLPGRQAVPTGRQVYLPNRQAMPTGRQARYEIRDTKETTDLFIYPGFKFKTTDALLTNFHLPKTTLLMLVSAFAGRNNIMRAYSEAIYMKYRFYSYGDAMLII